MAKSKVKVTQCIPAETDSV